MTAQQVRSNDAPRAAAESRVTVGVVIVNYNGGDRVLRALDALHRQNYPLADVVIVDNHSSDGSSVCIRERFPGVRIVDLPSNIGLAAARNLGLRQLDTALVFLVDHDIYVEHHSIERMVGAYEQVHAAVICPRIRFFPETDIIQVEGAAPHFLGTLVLRHGYCAVADTLAEAGYVGGAPGGCLLVDRERILKAGGFDDLFFFYFEDLEFSMRLRALGEKFWCEPNAEVYHEPAAGTPGLSFRGEGDYPARRAYLTMRNRLLAIFIHYRWRTVLVLLPVLLLYEAASAAMAIRKGWPLAWVRAWLWQGWHIRTIISRRRGIQDRRTIGDKDILVGGDPPLAPGFLRTSLERRLFKLFSRIVNGYWTLCHNWVG